MITKKEWGDIIYNHLLDDGWHIGDGVDDCSGHDGEAMDKSCATLILKIQGQLLKEEIKR